MGNIFDNINLVLGDNKDRSEGNTVTFNRIVRHLLLRLWDVYEKDKITFWRYENAQHYLGSLASSVCDYEFTINKNDICTYTLVAEKHYRSAYAGCDTKESFSVPVELLADDWEDMIDEIIMEKKRLELKKEIDEVRQMMDSLPDKLNELEKQYKELN